MNSSISISESGWHALLRRYAFWTVIFGLMIAVFVIGLDPYDLGHFALFGNYGVPHFGQRLAVASLGRQAQYDTAIIGNSTLQLIDPQRLAAKGIHAVSLTIPGTGPLEQLSVAKWFVRHHPGDKTRALIIGIDQRWCEANRPPDLIHPFPFWLYGAGMDDYVVNMMSYQTLELATRKIGLMLGRAQPLRSDGYNDYDADRIWSRESFLERISAPPEEGAVEAGTPPYDFAAASLLRDFLAQLSSATVVVLAMPPQFRPDQDGNAGAQRKACEKTYKTLIAQRPHTQFLDFLTRPDLTLREDDYWDHEHYRSRVARVMETRMASAVKLEQ